MLSLVNKVFKYITTFLSNGIIELTPIFIVAAMIGILISMVGFRKLGTRISSLSFLIYILLKVVL